MNCFRLLPAVFCRGLQLSACLNNANVLHLVSARQRAKLMSKFLATAKKRERQLLALPTTDVTSPTEGGATANDVRVRPLRSTSAKHRHRLEALSAIYLQRITEVLSTGELLPDLLESGVSLTKVQLAGNMRLVYVFWTSPVGADDRVVSEQLHTASPHLRELLAQQRITGHLPGIKFVRDADNTAFLEVERQLALADYGPDFEPTDPTHFVKRRDMLGGPVTAGDTERISSRESLPVQATPSAVPEMSHSAGGLDHAAILTEVQRGILRSSAPHRQLTVHPEAITPRAPDSYADAPAQLQSFGRFTQQRKWARQRQNRQSSSVSPSEWEFLHRRENDSGDCDPEEAADAAAPDDITAWEEPRTDR